MEIIVYAQNGHMYYHCVAYVGKMKEDHSSYEN